MIWLRLPQLRTTTKLESLVSREAAFLYNNLLLVALCLTILWGTAWPMVSEAVRGETMVVGRPYFDFFLRVFGLPLLLLMGIGPLVAWRRASLRGLLKTFAWPASVALATGVILIAFGAGSSIPGLVAYSFSAFVLATIVHEFARGTAARRALTGETVPTAFGQLIGAQPATVRGLRRPRGDRAAGDRGRGIERLRLGRGGEARDGGVDADRRLHARLSLARRARRPERHRDARRRSVSGAAGRIWGRSRPARTPTRSSSRSRTRSGSAATGSPARTCS